MFAQLAHAADDASGILENATKRLTEAKSVTATFTVTSNGRSANGELTASGAKFTATINGLRTWFDGQTQWTLSPRNREVTIIEPTPDELAQSNPLAVLRSLSRGYKGSILKSAAGTKCIRMTGSRNTDFKQVTIVLNASDLQPKTIDVTTADGASMKIQVTSLKTGGALPASTFVFDKKSFPGVRLNDMR